jgi:4-amino-4-deoxy-L-arabinose transferase-like glycosyltransferase
MVVCGLAMLLSIFTYFYGLASAHIPKNGDESVYINITRLTGASGHWLPLQSEDLAMRNTKPPLLFWQGIESTDHARDWNLVRLRGVSVIYTLLTATLVFLVALRCTGDWSRGLTGALVYLAFWSTYRYGRPFMTDAPQTFWLFLTYFLFLYWPEFALGSRWLPVLGGVICGIGLLYKSFALVASVALAVGWWYLHRRNYEVREFLRRDAWKPVVLSLTALAVFSLWLWMDPEPGAIWNDFVLQQNIGKLDASGSSYGKTLLWGGSSLWTMVIGGPVNAGLLALPVAALMMAAVRRRLSDAEKLSWIWLLAFLVVFTLPSQRSIRYLLPAMPALAVLCAIGFAAVRRAWFIAAVGVAAALTAFVAFESVLLERAIGIALFGLTHWMLLTGTLCFCLAAMIVARLTRPAAPVAALLVYCIMASFLSPFDGTPGNFDAAAQARISGRDVWVPSNFSSGEEAYRFLLPTANIHRYPEARAASVTELAQRYPIFTVRLPLNAAACAACTVLGHRLDLRGRLDASDIRAMLHGRAFETLFLEEFLIESSGSR